MSSNIPFKTRYYNFLILKNSNIYNDPIFKLASSYNEIVHILDMPDCTKYLYSNAHQINQDLYQKEEVVPIIGRMRDKKLGFYYYLILLIKENPDIINYQYSFEFVKEFNDENNKNNNDLMGIINSKIIIELINNYLEYEYDEEKEKKIKEMKIINLQKIKDEISLLRDINLDLDEKSFIKINIDDLYIEIIIQLIKKDKISDFEEKLSQLDFENIYLTKKMLDKLSKIMNDENLKKYIIEDYNDLLNINIRKLNFHFILLKYILKDCILIYQIPFFLINHKNIIKIIKNTNSELFEIQINRKEEIWREKLDFILKKYAEPNYYQKYIRRSLEISSTSIKIADISGSNSTLENSEDRQSKGKDNENDKSFINHLIILIHTNKKGEEPYIIYDKIFIGKSRIEISKNDLYNIAKNNPNKKENLPKFLEFLEEFENRIKDEFTYNYCLKLKLEFKILPQNPDIDNSIYNISCVYTFYFPSDKKGETYMDDNILINKTNSNSNGFNFMMSEINEDRYKEKQYEYNDNFTKNNKSTSIKQKNHRKKKQIFNTLRNRNKKNNSLIQNSIYTNKSSLNTNWMVEAKKEEIIVPIAIIDETDTKKKIDLFMQLSNGNFLCFEREKKTLLVYTPDFSGKETLILEEVVFNISERHSNGKNIQIIICCLKNIYLVTLHGNKIDNVRIYNIPNIICFLCNEIKENNFIISGESSTMFCKNLFAGVGQSEYSNRNISQDVFLSGITISDNAIALSSNSVAKNCQDNLIIYNIDTQKITKIFGYSYIYSSNGLSLMNINDKKFLLCACKKYFPEQKNGIVVVDLSKIDKEKNPEKFVDTDSFEVNCVKPLFNIKNSNSYKNNMKTVKLEEIEYFLAGGFDPEAREGKIKLFKILYAQEENDFSIEYLQDIEFEDSSIFSGFNGSISCIEQSKKTGNILIHCTNGKLYLFSKPNLEYYLEEKL